MTIDDTVIEYRADTLGVISALLAGYSGGITIVREMAQNADDVPGDDDRWLEFHFHPEKLIIRNNTRFRDIDFENINKIARGGKRLENRNTIGAFGVGFVSVYQLTDTPILRSSGRELQFFPATGQARQRGSAVVDYTEFEQPYRRQASEVGNRLGMPPVTELWVKEIKQRGFTLQQWQQLGRRSLFDVMSAEAEHYNLRVSYVNALHDQQQLNANLLSLGRGVLEWLR